MFLLLYMNGDGIGMGTHLSFFFKLMSGEYDGQLPRPFRKTLKLILHSQDGKMDIIRVVKHDEAALISHSEENIAYGFPKFAPLSVLDSPSYVKDDTLHLTCTVGSS